MGIEAIILGWTEAIILGRTPVDHEALLITLMLHRQGVIHV